jgi:phospholipase/carboxylesterase
MTLAEISLAHLVRRPAQPAERPPLLVLLHGFGSNEHDLFSLAPALDDRFVVVSARGPHSRAPGGHSWYATTFTPGGPLIDAVQAEGSRQRLIDFIGEACAAYGADPDRVFLMGFSQGAIMSASVALTRPDLVAGAVLMSGRILSEIRPLIAPAEQLTGLPLLVVHGAADAVLPIQNGRASRALLEALPVQLTYREYQMGHEVSQESLGGVAAWLRERLEAPSSH